MKSLFYYSFFIILFILNNGILANANSLLVLQDVNNNETSIHNNKWAVGVVLYVGTSAIYVSRKIIRFNDYLGLSGYFGVGFPLFPNIGFDLNISNLFNKNYKLNIYKHFILLNLISDRSERKFTHNHTISISHQWKLKNDPVYITLGIQKFSMTMEDEKLEGEPMLDCNLHDPDDGCKWVSDIRNLNEILPTFSLEYRF